MKIFQRKQKKAMSTAYAWIFGLVSLFGLGVMYIVFSQVFTANLVPIIKGQVNQSNVNYHSGITPGINDATMAEINSGIDRYMKFFNALPFFLFIIVIIFMVMVAWRKDTDSEQF